MVATVNSTGTSTGVVITPDSSGVLALQTGGTTAITVDASQNVIVGTGSTTVPLTVTKNPSSSSSSLLYLNPSTGTNASAIGFNNSGSGGLNIGRSDSAGAGSGTTITAYDSFVATTGTTGLSFHTNNTRAMYIDSGQNLLVGLTAQRSTEKLAVSGSASNFLTEISNTASSGSILGVISRYPNYSPNSSGNDFFRGADSTATRFGVYSNGGIANYSANNVNLSDQREKKNIELASKYLDKICAIPVKTFLYNDQTDTDKNLGAIAQDVQAICPELVSESNWGTEEEPKMRLSIYQTDLQYALMKSIQELKTINDTQAETINALTARIVALESK